MSDWPAGARLLDPHRTVLSTGGSNLGLLTTVSASVAWPSANLAIFVPIKVGAPVTIYKMVVGTGTGTGGNFDVGIYDRFGNRLVSSGATARPGASVDVVVDITDTRIGPGLYYLALALDGTTTMSCNVPSGTAPVPLQKTRAFGVLQAASSYVLPDPVTFAAIGSAVVPAIAAYARSY